MSTRLTKAGAQASIEDRDGRGGLSIALAQPKGSTARWRFSVRAHTKDGMFEIGRFTTCPPDNNQLTRIIALANCPGARNWSILITLADGENDNATVDLAVGDCCGSEPGLVRVNERYHHYAAAASASVNIPEGETVLGWTAVAGPTLAPVATVSINGFSPIPIPPGGSMAGAGGGLLKGPVSFTFANDITGWLIEVARSA